MDNINTPEELLQFMNSNINYGYLDKDYNVHHDADTNFFDSYILESKDDLLRYKYGNCFDQVELERYWFLNHGYDIKTIFEMVLLDYPNSYPMHSFLIYKDGNSWCWFENADIENRGIHKFDDLNKLLNYQYNKYITGLKELNISNEELKKIIRTSFSKPQEHINTKEYIDFVTNFEFI